MAAPKRRLSSPCSARSQRLGSIDHIEFGRLARATVPSPDQNRYGEKHRTLTVTARSKHRRVSRPYRLSRVSACHGRASDRETPSQLLHRTYIMALGARIETAHRHVFDHALAQRADRLAGHRETPEVRLETLDPQVRNRSCWVIAGIDSCCGLSSRHHARSARGFDFLAAQQEA